MNASKRIRICIWGGIALILTAVLILGTMDGGLGKVFSIGGASVSFSYAESDAYTTGGASISAASINRVEVNWLSGAVNIRFYDGDAIVFSESSNQSLEDNQTMRYRVQNGVLTLQYCRSTSGVSFFGSMPSKTLELLIPKTAALSSLHIENVSSSITLDAAKVSINAISIESVSGSISLDNLFAHTLDVESVSGGIDISGAVDAVNVQSISGQATLKLWKLPTEMYMESISGGIRVCLPENDGFTATLETLSGSMRCSFANMTGKKTAVYKNGGAKLSFENISGSVTIELDAGLSKNLPVSTSVKNDEPAAEPTPTGSGAPIPSSGRSF